MNAPPSPTPGGEVSGGETLRWMSRVDKQLGALTEELREQRTEYVHRTEWDLWRENANRELAEMRAGGKVALDVATAAARAAEAAADTATAAAKAVEDSKGALSDHEDRLRAVEHVVWKAAGGAAALGAGAGFGLTQLFHLTP